MASCASSFICGHFKGRYSSSYIGSFTRNKDYKLSSNTSWFWWVSVYTLSQCEQVINSGVGCLLLIIYAQPWSSSQHLYARCFYWATAACLQKADCLRREDVWGRLLCGKKEIASTAPTSVCPCLSEQPACWLMEPTYVTNIPSAGRQTDRQESCADH